jgi:mRNA-degrading endonuclease YafQ of YafQ-DinJ toxin-antitoxin module
MPLFEARPSFRRRYRKLVEPERRAGDRAVRLLATDPRDRRLSTHKLEGGERWACRYAYDGRIVFTWEADMITLLDVGSRDDVN